MNAIELLRKGIQTRDFGPIIQAFTLLTGEALPGPPTEVAQTRGDETGAFVSREEGRPQPSPPNRFVDDFTIALDQRGILPRARTERRPPMEFARVVCSRCQQTDQVPPALVPRPIVSDDERKPEYICGRCLNKGRRHGN
jgi:hypothetical protein